MGAEGGLRFERTAPSHGTTHTHHHHQPNGLIPWIAELEHRKECVAQANLWWLALP